MLQAQAMPQYINQQAPAYAQQPQGGQPQMVMAQTQPMQQMQQPGRQGP